MFKQIMEDVKAINVVANTVATEKVFPTITQLEAAAGWLRHNGFLVLPENWMVEPVRRDLEARFAPHHISVAMQNGLGDEDQTHAILLLS